MNRNEKRKDHAGRNLHDRAGQPAQPEPGWPYADIVDLPHHVSKKHPQMEMAKRAAQFAPFAALTGFEEAIDETAKRQELAAKMENRS